MKIALGCDHVGIELKNIIKKHLEFDKGYECIDFGGFDPSIKVDYPEKGLAVGAAVANGDVDFGIVICGTGVGISISANKVPGVRAVVCSEPYSAKLAKQHNDANIVAFGSRVVGPELAKMIVDEFFDASFLGERHAKRVSMIKEIEKKYSKIK